MVIYPDRRGEIDLGAGAGAIVVISSRVSESAVLIVGFRNPSDICNCLTALSKASAEAQFDIFICENGGAAAYRNLIRDLIGVDGPCEPGARSDEDADRSGFTELECLGLRGKSSRVWIACAPENLGYAGGINAWLRPLLRTAGWKGVWILNPDAEPYPDALKELIGRAIAGNKAMVGSTILEEGQTDVIRFRGGLRWERFTARSVAIGFGDPLQSPYDLSAIEASMDSPSGASMYVTRACVEKIGLPDASYFLFFEDLDWGVKAKPLGLGYAAASIVAHKRGTTTGSTARAGTPSRLSVYLLHRNAIHFVRRYFPWTVPLRVCVSLLYAFRFLLRGAPQSSAAVLEGIFAGLRGEVGRPAWHRDQPPIMALGKPVAEDQWVV
ncbi:N-acetylglucosaminyl-diphospho-decaprenol L-rhamnosyltransferase [Nitrobacteraceae bacterium AZCC 1564]